MENKHHKQTSVEWLWQQIDDVMPFINLEVSQVFNGLLNAAKEMHKQEIIDAYATVITKYNGVKSWTKIHDEEAEQYYNEIYLNNQVKPDN